MRGYNDPHTRLQQLRYVVNDDIIVAFNNLSEIYQKEMSSPSVPFPLSNDITLMSHGRFFDNGLAYYGIR